MHVRGNWPRKSEHKTTSNPFVIISYHSLTSHDKDALLRILKWDFSGIMTIFRIKVICCQCVFDL